MTMWSLWTCVFAVLLSGATAGPLSQEYDVIVIGLGSAGTTAASTLARAGRRVLAIDALGRVGGRVRTVNFGDGVVEVGAEWIHGTKSSRVYDAAVSNNVSTIKDKEGVLTLFRSDGRLADDYIEHLVKAGYKILEEPKTDKPEPISEYGTRRLMEYIREKKPEYANDTKLIQETLRLMDFWTDGLEASNSWTDVDASSIGEELDGYQFTSWHRHGYRTFFEILLNTYKNGPGLPSLEIKLTTEVTQIQWPTKSEEKVLVKCYDGTVYSADTAIVTASVGVLKERYSTLFSPALPQDKVTAIEKIAMGLLGKIIMSFDTAWWPTREASYFFMWKTDDLKAVPAEDQWTTKLMACSFPAGSSNTITTWIVGEEIKLMETLPEEEVKSKVLAVLRRFIANATIPDPTAMIRSTWYSNPYTRGSYTYDSMQAASLTAPRATLAAPLNDESGRPRLLFAGEATHETHFGTVHGASETGYREAERILAQTNQV